MNKIKLLTFLMSVAVFSSLVAHKDPFERCVNDFCRSNYDLANACFERTIPTVSDFTPQREADFGESLLGSGRYTEGWEKRDARLRIEGYSVKLVKRWDGSNPYGKKNLNPY